MSTVPMDPMTMAVRNRARLAPVKGLNEASRAMNSPQNPARPGRPREAMAAKARMPPRMGSVFWLPPRRAISRVW